MESSKDKDLDDVMKEETSRGTRHPKKAVTLEERRRLSAAYKKIAKRSFTEEQVAEALKEVGMKPSENRYQTILKAWKEYSGK
jgi:ribosomal protein L12E/L44/L45/RPP1/RPP2